ncbi:hypothetical protein AVEN_259353-1 [Araneus ventricosus]|uniref:Uncharacterized protein n=1 Tax=Araneus ventricosus TaxID=182803 RepID=A0A4Y2DTT8_ARAVE|nr:hypothetical protein AVEN_259353-1 [Araneus ventricosus]
MTRTSPELAPALQTFAPHQRTLSRPSLQTLNPMGKSVDVVWAPQQREDVCPAAYDLIRNRPTYTADLQWNRVSNLEFSDPEAETLPLGHNHTHDVLLTSHFEATKGAFRDGSCHSESETRSEDEDGT